MQAPVVSHAIPPDVQRSIDALFEPGEDVLGALSSLAGSLFVTDRRVVIVREGRGYRPQSGIRSWDISRKTNFTYGAPRGGMGRLMIGDGKTATSFFVKSADWEEALRLVTVAHGIAYRQATTNGSGPSA